MMITSHRRDLEIVYQHYNVKILNEVVCKVLIYGLHLNYKLREHI